MADDDAPADAVVEDELDRQRRSRFGKLPERVSPADFVELVEADPARETHEPIEPRREWG